EIADAMQTGRVAFDAEHELGIRKNQAQGSLDPGVEATGCMPISIEREQRLEVRPADWTPPGPASQSRQNLRRARLILIGADKDPAAARCIAGPGRIVRAGYDELLEVRKSGFVDRVECRPQEWLQDVVGLSVVLLDESDADLVRTGFDPDASLEPRFERLAAGDRVLRGEGGIFPAADRGLENTRAVDEDFDLVRFFKAARHFHAVAREHGFERVFGVERKVVAGNESAARAEREAFDVLVL